MRDGVLIMGRIATAFPRLLIISFLNHHIIGVILHVIECASWYITKGSDTTTISKAVNYLFLGPTVPIRPSKS